MTISAPIWADAPAHRPWAQPVVRRGESQGAHRPDTPAVDRPLARAAALARLSPAAQVLTALTLMCALQVAALPSQDPAHTVVSQLFYAPGGAVLFPLAAGLIALAAVVWARQLARLGRRLAASLALAASAGLLLLGAFPTDPTGAAGISAAAQVHRYAALSIFIAIPAAAVLGHVRGRRVQDARRLRALRLSVAICLAAAIPALLGLFPALLPDGFQQFTVACHAVRGLVERTQLVTMTVIVILGVALSRGGARPARRAALEPHRVMGAG